MANTTRNITYPTSSDYVAPLETVFATLASSADDALGVVEEKANRVYTNSTARDAAIATPTEGMVSILTDSDAVQIYNGGSWVNISEYGSWRSWTPAIGGWTPNATPTHTFDAKYAQLGKVVHFSIIFTIGNCAPTTSGITFSLPVEAARINVTCSGMTTTSVNTVIVGQLNSTTTILPQAHRIAVASGGGAQTLYPVRSSLTTTVPGTWTSTHKIFLAGSYEAL